MRGEDAVLLLPIGYVEAHYDKELNKKELRFCWGELSDVEDVVLSVEADTAENATVMVSLQRIVTETDDSSVIDAQLGFDVTMAVKQGDEPVVIEVTKHPESANMQSRITLKTGEFSNLVFYEEFMSLELAEKCLELPDEYIQISYEDLEEMSEQYIENYEDTQVLLQKAISAKDSKASFAKITDKLQSFANLMNSKRRLISNDEIDY